MRGVELIGGLILGTVAAVVGLVVAAGYLVVFLARAGYCLILLGLLVGFLFLMAYIASVFFPSLPLWAWVTMISFLALCMVFGVANSDYSSPAESSNRSSSWLYPLAIGLILGNVFEHHSD